MEAGRPARKLINNPEEKCSRLWRVDSGLQAPLNAGIQVVDSCSHTQAASEPVLPRLPLQLQPHLFLLLSHTLMV